MTTWDVSVILTFLFTLYPLSELSLKLLTYKLIALTTAARAQTISALDINYMSKCFNKYDFQIQQLLKTSRPGVSLPKVVLYKFDKKKNFVFFILSMSILIELIS